jgi:hypothetical protein
LKRETNTQERKERERESRYEERVNINIMFNIMMFRKEK